MPPVYLFTDARLLPKWYLFVSVLAVTGLLAAVTWLRGKPLPGGIGALASFGKVFTIADKDIKVYSSAFGKSRRIANE